LALLLDASRLILFIKESEFMICTSSLFIVDKIYYALLFGKDNVSWYKNKLLYLFLGGIQDIYAVSLNFVFLWKFLLVLRAFLMFFLKRDFCF
jgi:hypothetical protein